MGSLTSITKASAKALPLHFDLGVRYALMGAWDGLYASNLAYWEHWASALECTYQIQRYPFRGGVVRCMVGRLPNTNAKVAVTAAIVTSKPLLRSNGRCWAGAMLLHLYCEH